MWLCVKYKLCYLTFNLFPCVVFKEGSSTGSQRTLVTWTLCSHGRLSTLSRWVSPRQVWSLELQHGKAISCLAKPALWSGSPNLETITVGLPASAAQRLHRFNKSVHRLWVWFPHCDTTGAASSLNVCGDWASDWERGCSQTGNKGRGMTIWRRRVERGGGQGWFLNSKGWAAGVRCACGNRSVWGGGVPRQGIAQHNAIPLMISHPI